MLSFKIRYLEIVLFVIYPAYCLVTVLFNIEFALILYYKLFQLVGSDLYPNL